MLHLYHAVVAVEDLVAAITDRRALGFTVVRGGIHANRATHNALMIFLDGTYLELLRDPSPDVLDSALYFFFDATCIRDVIDIIQNIRGNDPSLTVRNVPARIPPE